MRALAITDVGKVEFCDRAAPQISAEHILLDVTHVGLCGSDLNTFRGLNPLAELPRVPGHEIAGTISDVGDGVSDEFAIGRNAIVIPYTECGDCSACRKGQTNACRFNKTLGVQQEGGMCEQLLVHNSRIILNDTLSSEHRALVEPLSVGFHAVDRSNLNSGETVVVMGAGMIGVGAMIGAIARGARVIAIEVSKPKTDILLALGVEEVLNPIECNISEEVNRLTENEGADIVVEAVGLPETFRNAIDLACFGGRVVYVGYAKDEVAYDTKFFNLKELDIFGSRNATRKDFEAVIEYISDNSAAADRLISKIFPWEYAEESFDYWESVRDRTFKIMIDMKEKAA